MSQSQDISAQCKYEKQWCKSEGKGVLRPAFFHQNNDKSCDGGLEVCGAAVCAFKRVRDHSRFSVPQSLYIYIYVSAKHGVGEGGRGEERLTSRVGLFVNS